MPPYKISAPPAVLPRAVRTSKADCPDNSDSPQGIIL